jgi:hypothetical protein
MCSRDVPGIWEKHSTYPAYLYSFYLLYDLSYLNRDACGSSAVLRKQKFT